MISLRDMSLYTHALWLAVIVVAALAFLGVLGLRLQRRGAARFWGSPAALALCVLPAALGAAGAGLLLRDALSALTLTGSGGVAAIAAGTAEALTPLVVGLMLTALLAGCAFLAMAIGSSRANAPEQGALTGWSLLAGAFVVLLLLGGLVAWLLDLAATVNSASAASAALGPRSMAVLVGASTLVVLAFVLAVAAAFMAPRGPSGMEVALASLAAFVLCGLAAGAGAWATWTRTGRLVETALTGVREGELPVPVQAPVAEPSPLAEEPPPPPPPPPPRRSATRRESELDMGGVSGRDAAREEVAPSGSSPRAVRIGGTIREPRKIRNVSPVYPDIARQARVQGVVILEVTISPRGQVTDVRVLRGIPLLDQSAIDAVRQWVYEPTLLNGVPVPVIMTVTVNYRLS